MFGLFASSSVSSRITRGAIRFIQTDDPNEWTNLAGNPEYDSLKRKCAAQLPKEEAPQITSGREFYNVADAVSPIKNVQSYKQYVKKYKELGLKPLLE